MSKPNQQQGVILYLAVVITTIMLAIALGVSSILLGQIKTIKEMGFSVKAFYGADTGVERALKEGDFGSSEASPESLGGGVEYWVVYSDPITIQSYGTYKGVRRAIEIGL